MKHGRDDPFYKGTLSSVDDEGAGDNGVGAAEFSTPPKVRRTTASSAHTPPAMSSQRMSVGTPPDFDVSEKVKTAAGKGDLEWPHRVGT